MSRFPRLALLLLIGLIGGAVQHARAEIVAIGPIAAVDSLPGRLEFRVQVEHASATLTITGPNGFYLRQESGSGKSLGIDMLQADRRPLAEGTYNYHLHIAPVLNEETQAILEKIKNSPDRDAVVALLQAEGLLPSEPLVQTASFGVLNQSFLVASSLEPLESDHDPGTVTPLDVIHADDVIITMSLCVGFGCADGENFGFDTLRLKEDNTRIKFEDTSSAAGFASTDWQLTANDSGSGGQNRFSIEDITAARIPFTVEGGATTNSIYIDSTGRVGFRTSTPALDLHVATGNTPAIRLEQNNTSGFSAYTWDVAGNEAGFFVRDTTAGSRLPFRIRPGAMNRALVLHESENVGFGLDSPQASMHFVRTASVTTRMQPDAVGWDSSYTSSSLTGAFIPDVNAPDPVTIYTWDPTGNLTIGGVLTQSSDRNKKENFEPVDKHEVLARVSDLPLSAYNFKEDTSRHVGPMAQDFHAAFGLGPDEKHIAPLDAAGVALAAIQGLDEIRREQETEIERLKAENESLSSRLAALESLVQQRLAAGK